MPGAALLAEEVGAAGRPGTRCFCVAKAVFEVDVPRQKKGAVVVGAAPEENVFEAYQWEKGAVSEEPPRVAAKKSASSLIEKSVASSAVVFVPVFFGRSGNELRTARNIADLKKSGHHRCDSLGESGFKLAADVRFGALA